MTAETYEAVVIGTGFGGAITGCRLARRWPGKVALLERGRRYPMGSFPRAPEEMARNVWSVGSGQVGKVDADSRGLFEVRDVGRMDVLVAAGLGGGSLVYANVFLEPPPEVFDDHRWPASCDATQLAPYYRVAKEVLGARTVPIDQGPRSVPRNGVFVDVAARLGRRSRPAEVNVFFGNDPKVPLAPGTEDVNRYGATQTSCIYCAECDIGCNVHAKNTLDLNYLHRAERAHDATILTGHQVERIEPIGADGINDPSADGTHGYLVTSRNLDTDDMSEIRTRRVVMAAGTLGSVELLLRARDVHRTLRRLSPALGQGFSGNGDFLVFVAGIDEPTGATRGPVITQYTDYGLFDHPRGDGFIMQDAGFPVLLAWFAEGAKPGVLKFHAIADAAWRMFDRVRGRSGGAVGAAIGALLRHGLTEGSAVLLCMGRDSSSGTLRLDQRGHLGGHWPQRDNIAYYRSILNAGKAFEKASGADTSFAMPTWWLPLRRNVTVHPLGGCALADTPSAGVVSGRPEDFGQVFGYRNLYVADGSIFPAAVGANPSATIAALAERVAEGITGLPPDSNL